MRERRFTILSTASLPFERISNIPDSIDVRVIPFIEIVERSDEKTKNQIASLSVEKITVVFTSAHAVKFVANWLKGKPDWKIYCIRNETRIAVERYFGHDCLVKFADNATHLSAKIISDGIQDVVFFCGDQRMNILPDNIKKNGMQLTEVVVYDTRLVPKLLDEQPDVVLFFSPTAVRSYFSMNKLTDDIAVFAMGTTTANVLKQYTNHPLNISPESDKVYVLNMALKYAETHPII